MNQVISILREAKSFQDFLFRLFHNSEENSRYWNRLEHFSDLYGETRLSQSFFTYPNPYKVFGIDESHWGGNVYMDAVKTAGSSFVILKAKDGTVTTSNWSANWQRAKEAGLLRSAYAWLYPSNKVSAKLQAQQYWALIQDDPGELPPVIDFEWTRYMGEPANPNFVDLSEWVVEFNKLSPRKPILYSAAGYMDLWGQIPVTLKAQFSGIWIANYSVLSPTMPRGYSPNEWLFWQFTSSGDAKVYCPNDAGKLEVDLNYFNGTLGELDKFAGRVIVPPAQGDVMKATILADLNVRSSPIYMADGLNLIDVLHLNDVIYGEIDANGWLNFPRIYRAGGSVQETAGFARVSVAGVAKIENLNEPNPPAPAPLPSSKTIVIKVEGFKEISGTLDPE